MLQITPQHCILLAKDPVDFRAGIEGLCRLCHANMASDPFNGSIFVFTNRHRNAIKLLSYDGQGFWLCHKRLSNGRLQWWPQDNSDTIQLTASTLNILLYNGNPVTANCQQNWKPLPAKAA